MQFDLKSHPTVSALNTATVTFLTSAIAVMAMVFAHVLNHQSPASDTIQTWTCRWHNSKSLDGSPKMDYITNRNFGSLCAQSVSCTSPTLSTFFFVTKALTFFK